MGKLERYFYSKKVPDFISQIYFKKKNRTRRKQLSKLLNEGNDLMSSMQTEHRTYWNERIDQVMRSSDNESIPRSKDAGTLIDGKLVMHNGIKIDPLSYYSFPLLEMLISNQGVHEPQEEKIFQEVIHSLSRKQEQKTMLELGAYWSFYSMWFKKVFPNSRTYMAEPKRENYLYGKVNFKLNKLKGTFIHTKIGKQDIPEKNVKKVDSICAEQNIDFLDILHSDIQGFELDMLDGSHRMLSEQKIGYIFISTHSDELHYDCKKLLESKYNYQQVASADLKESYSWDGILVMKLPNYEGIREVEISKR